MEFMVLLLLCSLVLTARAAAWPPAVLDVDGDGLERGQQYYAVPAWPPLGGGLTLDPYSGTSCPVYVAQLRFLNEWGRPVTFSPENRDEYTVGEGHTLYVTFPATADDQCAESPGMWQVEEGIDRVSTNGTPSDQIAPHPSRFALQRVESIGDPTYKINYCPCSIGANRPSCGLRCRGSLGVVNDLDLLGLGADRPHTIRFWKVGKEPQPQPSTKIRSVVVRPRPT